MARLLTAAAPHNGDWSYALTIAACGLHWDNNSVSVDVSLRLVCAHCQAKFTLVNLMLPSMSWLSYLHGHASVTKAVSNVLSSLMV
jgi:hypothetical protein